MQMQLYNTKTNLVHEEEGGNKLSRTPKGLQTFYDIVGYTQTPTDENTKS